MYRDKNIIIRLFGSRQSRDDALTEISHAISISTYLFLKVAHREVALHVHTYH